MLINTNRILVDNYLSSKYGVVIANDVYAGDTVGSGDFDLNVAGIGQLAGAQHTASHAAGIPSMGTNCAFWLRIASG